MLVFLTEKLISQIKKHQYLTEDAITEYVDELIKMMDLHDYYAGIDFVDNYKRNAVTIYSFETKIITFSFNEVKIIVNEIIKNNNLNVNNIDFFNIYCILNLLHEVIHIVQYYLIGETDWAIAELFYQELMLVSKMKDNEIYDNYHDLFAFERDAILTSLETIESILDEYFDFKEIREFIHTMLIYHLEYGYFCYEDAHSPMELIFQDLFKIDAPTLENLDDYNMIKLGCSINEENYQECIKLIKH